MKFFVLEQSPNNAQSDFATDSVRTNRGNNLGQAPRCPLCGEYISGRVWIPPYEVNLNVWGKGFADFVGSGEILVSERFKSLFEEEGLNGLSGFHPVTIAKVKHHRRIKGDPPRYFAVEIARSRAAIDAKASGIEREAVPPVCSECRIGGITHRIARIILEADTWSNEDIFTARGLPGTVIVSERFKQFSENHAIKNVVLIPTEDYAVDYYPSQKEESSSDGRRL